MKPFRKHVALSVDGGGIRGIIVTRALCRLEAELGRPARQIFGLAAGTSTGSAISAGIAASLNAKQLHELYMSLGGTIFRKTLRSSLWLLARYRYPLGPLEAILREQVGDMVMADLWAQGSPTDLVITTFDVMENRTRFIKPWKEEYARWPVARAVLASSAVPTVFPPVDGRFVDGGIGSYANPCYLAAFEAWFCLGWDPAETTLISLGTGRAPRTMAPGDADRLWPWQWLDPVLNAFAKSAGDQQVNVVAGLFPALDFRRFDVALHSEIPLDGIDRIPELVNYGDELWRKIRQDETETPPDFRSMHPKE
jgi:predicted acylesterase/phospholipase RssA